MYDYRLAAWEIKKILKRIKSGHSLEECIRETSLFTREIISKGYAKTALEIGEYYNSLLALGLGTLLEAISIFQEEPSRYLTLSLGIVMYAYSILNIAYTKLVLEERLKGLKIT